MYGALGPLLAHLEPSPVPSLGKSATTLEHARGHTKSGCQQAVRSRRRARWRADWKRSRFPAFFTQLKPILSLYSSTSPEPFRCSSASTGSHMPLRKMALIVLVKLRSFSLIVHLFKEENEEPGLKVRTAPKRCLASVR